MRARGFFGGVGSPKKKRDRRHCSGWRRVVAKREGCEERKFVESLRREKKMQIICNIS